MSDALKALGLARLTIVYLAENGAQVTKVCLLPEADLKRVVAEAERAAVG